MCPCVALKQNNPINNKMDAEIRKQCFNRWDLQSQPHATDRVAHAFRSLCMLGQHPLIPHDPKPLSFSSGKEGKMSKYCICLFCRGSRRDHLYLERRICCFVGAASSQMSKKTLFHLKPGQHIFWRFYSPLLLLPKLLTVSM